MLLGILLHGLLSFIPIPFWPAQDIHQNEHAYGLILVAIHGFRMPLFFLISGFFTAMMWKNRGLRGLLKHRYQRIVIPLVVLGAALFPMANHMGKLNEWKNDKDDDQPPEQSAPAETPDNSDQGQSLPFFEAAKAGDVASLRQHLDEGANVEGKDSTQFTALHWAASLGHAEIATLLLEHGAETDSLDGHGSTPLHLAAFLGHPGVAKILLEHGADPIKTNKSPHTPVQLTKQPPDVTQWVARDILKIHIEWETVQAGRAEVIQLLGGRPQSSLGTWFDQNYRTHGKFNLHHLWFLYDLLWLVAGFSLLASLSPPRLFDRLLGFLTESPLRLLWLIPITFIPQFFMHEFGPDTSVELAPNFIKLGYYFIFFLYGAACFGRTGFVDQAGRRWPVYFIVAVPILLLGITLHEEIPQGASTYKAWSVLCAVTYAWLIILGSIGFFRKYFSSENPCVRYISDSAYWLYLGHLPLIQVLQIWVSDWNIPSLLKLIFVCTLTTAILLAAYEYLIRYTPVGTMLNGKRHKTPCK